MFCSLLSMATAVHLLIDEEDNEVVEGGMPEERRDW